VALFFSRLGLSCLDFSNPVYSYDMTFAASRAALPRVEADAAASALSSRPVGRLVQALLDKARESTDRGWAIQRLEARQRPPS